MATLVPTSADLLQFFDTTGPTLQSLATATQAMKQLRQDTLALKAGKLAGALIRWPAGNRFAYYRVRSARPLQLEHIPMPTGTALDPEQLAAVRLTDVKSLVDKERRWLQASQR